MPEYKVKLLRVDRIEMETEIVVEADNADDARDQAWELDSEDLVWSEIDRAIENMEFEVME